jgi:hypothetical protein
LIDRIISELWLGNYLEGNGHDLISVPSCDLPGGTEKNYK